MANGFAPAPSEVGEHLTDDETIHFEQTETERLESTPNHDIATEPLDDLLLAVGAQRASVELRVETKLGVGHVTIAEGQLAAARFGVHDGVRAVKSLLAFKEGVYQVAHTSHLSASRSTASEPGQRRNIAEVVRAHVRSSTQLSASGNRSALSLSSVLFRGDAASSAPASSLSARVLECIDGHASALEVVQQIDAPAAEILRCLRDLMKRGTIRQQAAQRLSPSESATWGLVNQSQVTDLRSTVKVFHAAAGSRADTSPTLDGGFLGRPAARDHSEGAPAPGEPSRASGTGRRAGQPDSRRPLEGTGYSSVPPLGQAEEQVHLPSGFQAYPPNAPSDSADSSRPRRETDRGLGPHRSLSRTLLGASAPSDVREAPGAPAGPFTKDEPVRGRHTPPMRRDTPTALSIATIFPDAEAVAPPATAAEPHTRAAGPPRNPALDEDDAGEAWRAASFMTESEMPLPSSKLDKEALEQLDELNEAVSRPNWPIQLPPPVSGDEFDEPSAFHGEGDAASAAPFDDSYGPPSSLGTGLSPSDLPPPGSVPSVGELPGGSEPPSSASSLPRVGRYEVLARIKRGGMGSVYMCRLSGNAGFRRLFAMKVLHGHLAAKKEALDAFFGEARVLGGLHHPNIVGIADVGSPSEPYIVMDYVEGGSLAELFRATKTHRNPALVISVVLDALSGLTCAHTATDENGQALELVHCDVTPHNLLVGTDGTCRVTDFGIAKTRVTGEDGRLIHGKPDYLAPERLRQLGFDHRADVFSMGVVLYTGLTGVEPFRGASPDETMQRILHDQIQTPSDVGMRPPPALDWVCMKALAKDPAERFSSAQEMAHQLRRIAAREELIASTQDVAAWVRDTLGPVLAARRAASMRGAGPSWTPPPVAEASSRSEVPRPSEPGDEPQHPSSHLPSSLGATGPLEPPPSSRAFSDKTQVITGMPREGAPMTRTRKLSIYAALVFAAAAAGWAMLSPETFASFVGMKSPAAQKIEPSLPALVPEPQPEQSQEKSAADTEEVVTIPRIAPQRGAND